MGAKWRSSSRCAHCFLAAQRCTYEPLQKSICMSILVSEMSSLNWKSKLETPGESKSVFLQCHVLAVTSSRQSTSPRQSTSFQQNTRPRQNSNSRQKISPRQNTNPKQNTSRRQNTSPRQNTSLRQNTSPGHELGCSACTWFLAFTSINVCHAQPYMVSRQFVLVLC